MQLLHNPAIEHFHHPCKIPFVGLQLIPSLTSDPRQPLIYFVSIDLPFLDVSYKWNHTVYGPFCLASFTYFIEVHPCCTVY